MASKNDDVLDLELRKRIFCLVSKFEGCHLRELERKSGVPYSTLKYHLHYMVRRGIVIEKGEKSNLRYFPSDGNSKNYKMIIILRQKNMRKIILFLLSNKKCTHGEIEGFTKLSGSTVSWYLKRLVKEGIVEKGANGRYSLKVEKGEVIKVLITFRESFLDALVDRVLEMWEVR